MNHIKQETILVMDDDPDVLNEMKTLLKEKYRVLFAKNGQRALEIVADQHPDLILLDVIIPNGMSGFEVCKQLKDNPDTTKIPVIFITIADKPELETHGISLGAFDYIIKKPLNQENKDSILAKIENHLELKAYREDLEAKVRERTQEIEELNREILQTQEEIIFRLGYVVENRSKETYNHVKRVSLYSKLLALKADLGTEKAELIKIASPMHDLGKISIPDNILKKPGKLTPEERKIMETHTTIGYKILKNSRKGILQAAADIAYQHHEWWNGSGYPQGLKEDNICIQGRIAAIADVFDALANKREYKEPWAKDQIESEFKKLQAIQFDPQLTDLFLENINEFYEILKGNPDIIISDTDDNISLFPG